MDVTQDEYDLLSELAAEMTPAFDAKRHVTAGMLAEKSGVSRHAAADKLNRMVKEDRLSREQVRLDNGKLAWGYFRKD